MRSAPYWSAVAVSLACSIGPLRAHAEVEVACPSDPLLSRAAAELLQAGRAPDEASLREALAQVGSDAVSAHALFVPMGASTPDSPDAWLARLSRRTVAPLVCGEAQGELGAMWLSAPRAGGLSLSSGRIPVVRGWLLPTFSDPALVLIDGDGRLTRLSVTVAALKDGVPLASDLRLPTRIQLVATGRHGPQPVAERNMLAPQDATDVARDGATASGLTLPGGGVSGRVNAVRRRRGVGEVRRHRLLRQLAAEHAHRVCQQGLVAHTLAPDRDPEARLRQAGLVSQRVGEAVARAKTPDDAFAALLRSPSHLMTLVEPTFTDAGVGVASDAEGRACLVVLVARWPRYVGN